MKKVLILAVLILLVFLVGCSFGNSHISTTPTSSTAGKTSVETPVNSDQLVTKSFTITGFTWASCAQTAKGALSSLDGVKSVSVETSGDTVITYEPKIVDMDKIRDTLKKLNYGLKNEQ